MSSKWTKFGVCLALLGMMPTQASAVTPYESHSIGSWKITREEDTCWAFAILDNGTAFVIARDLKTGLLAASSDSWASLDSHQGETLPVIYDFGPWTSKAKGRVGDFTLSPRSIVSVFPDGDKLWEIWAQSYGVVVTVGDDLFEEYRFYNGEDDPTHQLVADELARCVQGLR